MRRRSPSPWQIALGIGAVAYPFLVYWGVSFIPPSAFVASAVGLIAIRCIAFDRAEATRWLPPLAGSAIFLLLLSGFDSDLAMKAYPVAMSLTFAAAFGASLIWPPALVTRLALLREPLLSLEAIAYTRGVTKIWFVFLMGNAAVAAATALWGSLEVWTLWNGLISYLLMGALFLGEIAWRRLAVGRL